MNRQQRRKNQASLERQYKKLVYRKAFFTGQLEKISTYTSLTIRVRKAGLMRQIERVQTKIDALIGEHDRLNKLGLKNAVAAKQSHARVQST